MKNKTNEFYSILCTFILIIATIFITLFYCGYKIDINLSESLPYKIFISNTNITEIKNNSYVKFLNPRAKYYQNKTFTKKVLGQGGDKITIIKFNEIKDNIQGTITINEVVLNVKYKTNKGTQINILELKDKVIPEGKIFVYATHIDSYDSRYNEFGLIDKSEVVGVSTPLF